MQVLEHLRENRIARIIFPLRDQKTVTLDCVVRSLTPPRLDAVFLPDELPESEIIPASKCQVYFDYEAKSYSLIARVEGVTENGRRLRMTVLGAAPPVQRLGYFRVDADTTVCYRKQSEPAITPMRCWQGRVNISGEGIQIQVQEPFAPNQRIVLNISLGPGDQDPVWAVGEVVRRTTLGKGVFSIGLRFVDIETKAQDRIIAYCLAQERKQLRTKVRILGLD
jgi:hypothetical protein